MTHKKHSLLFIIATLAIFPLPQLAIDLYLPSLPAMVTHFHSSDTLLQLSLTVYILTLGITQLIYGPVSDRFGRKPVLLVGTVIFLLASLACVFATSITELLLFRILQGIGMGCGFTIGSAIIGDSFQGQQLARMTTFSSMIYAMSPLLAPVIGGYLQDCIGWRANFAFITIITVLLFLAFIFCIPETHLKPDLHALKPKNLALNYLKMFRSLRFVAYVMIATLAFGLMVTFNVIGPFLLQNALHVHAAFYGVLLLLVGLAYLIGTSLNSHILKFYSTVHLIIIGIGGMIVFSLGLLIAAWVGWFSVTSVTLFTCLCIFSSGFVFPNSFAKVLEVFPNNLGTASALMGAAGLIGTAIISVIAASVNANHAQPLAYLFIAQSVFALLFLMLALRAK